VTMIMSIHSWKRDNPRLTYEVNLTIFFTQKTNVNIHQKIVQSRDVQTNIFIRNVVYVFP
jgi:hypothetical protein